MTKNKHIPIRDPNAPLGPTEEELREWRIPPQYQDPVIPVDTSSRYQAKSLGNKDLTTPTPTSPASLRGREGTGSRDNTIMKEFGIRSLGEWAENEELLREPEKIGMLGRRGELTELVAREKMGKTTAAATDAIYSANEGYSVLWLSYEEGRRRVISRLHEITIALQMEKARPLIDIPADLPRKKLPSDGLGDLKRLIKGVKPDYVILDSASSFVEAIMVQMPEHSDGEKWQAVFNRLREIANDVNCAFLVLVHATKGDHMEARGSTGITAAADRIFYMDDRASKRKPQPRLKPFRGIKEVGRSGLHEFTLGFDSSTGTYYKVNDGTSDEARDSREDQVVYWVTNHPEMSNNEIYGKVGGNRNEVMELIKKERERDNGN